MPHDPGYVHIDPQLGSWRIQITIWTNAILTDLPAASAAVQRMLVKQLGRGPALGAL